MNAEASPDPAAAAVILLHGSGGDGESLRAWMEQLCGFDTQLKAAGIVTLYPTAPLRPYTLGGGFKQRVWFDRTALHPDAPEDADGIDTAVSSIMAVIDELGIPDHRIVVAGFSMGGALALHIMARFSMTARALAGVVCLSSFLAKDSSVIAAMREVRGNRTNLCQSTSCNETELKPACDVKPVPPVLMFAGDIDCMIETEWTENTAQRLSQCGLEVHFNVVSHMGHEVVAEEAAAVLDFTLACTKI